VIKNLIDEVPEEYFDVEKEGQVEIIGWLYQFYNTEPKDLAFKKKKYTSSDIPAVTQLFTPEWIVKYLVQNSLGRYWIDVLKSKNTKLTEKKIAKKFGWKYYMPAASENRVDCNNDLADIAVQDITFMDPAMGSGHILVYAFEVFMQIYKSEGYTEREAADLILQNNLFGTDIDTRAFQLTYFALVMQGRKKDRRFFSRNIALNIVDIPQPSDDIELLLSNFQDKKVSVASLRNITNKFANGNSLGSLIKTDSISLDELKQLLLKTDNTKQLTLEDSELENGKNELKEIIKSVDLLSKKYTISVSNPPYMGSGKMDSDLKKYVQKNYPNSKSDLFAVFIERLIELTQKNGYIAMITQHSWMFLSSFEKLRQKIQNKTIINLAHLGPRAFEEIGGEVVQSVAFVLQNKRIADYIGTYERLTDFNTAADKEKKYLKTVNESNLDYVFRSNQTKFANIPGSPIAYWASDNLIHDFIIGNKMENLVGARQGLATAKNDLFLRQWFEVDLNTISFNSKSILESIQSNKKWFPYNKGGSYRKWYGNYDYVVNWENDGHEIRNFKDSQGKLRSRPQNTNYYFREAITWPKITSGTFNVRFRKAGSIHDTAGNEGFTEDHEILLYLVGFTCSNVCNYILSILNPTINVQVSDFGNLPVIISNKNYVISIAKLNIKVAMMDWNAFEISWEYKKHPFLSHIAEHNLSPPFVIMFFIQCAKIVQKI